MNERAMCSLEKLHLKITIIIIITPTTRFRHITDFNFHHNFMKGGAKICYVEPQSYVMMNIFGCVFGYTSSSRKSAA